MDQETSSKWLLQPVEEWSGNKQPVTSVLLGILVCSGAIMILLHGIGLGSWSSAAVLICPLVGLVAVGHFRNTIWDSVFLLFVLWLGISTVVNGPGPLKEEILFILTLAAYPAARLSGTTGRPFFAVLGLVGFLGLVCIVVALRDQWSDLHGKPLVFGTFDAAPARLFCWLVSSPHTSIAYGWLSATYLPAWYLPSWRRHSCVFRLWRCCAR
jgi:hypothetical protein